MCAEQVTKVPTFVKQFDSTGGKILSGKIALLSGKPFVAKPISRKRGRFRKYPQNLDFSFAKSGEFENAARLSAVVNICVQFWRKSG